MMKDHKDGEEQEAGTVTEEDIQHLMKMLETHLKDNDVEAVREALSNFVGLDRKTFAEDAMGTLSAYLPEMVDVMEYPKDDHMDKDGHMDMESPFRALYEGLKMFRGEEGFDREGAFEYLRESMSENFKKEEIGDMLNQLQEV